MKQDPENAQCGVVAHALHALCLAHAPRLHVLRNLYRPSAAAAAAAVAPLSTAVNAHAGEKHL
jgi:hypothetical protein